MKEKFIRFICVFSALLLIVSANAAAFGAESGSITLEYPHVGNGFSLFRVADIAADGSFVKTRQFANVPVALPPSVCGDPAAAETLAGYVDLWQLSPQATANVGWDNLASFPGLSRGLYLITGSRYIVDGKTYAASPMLISVPSKDASGDELIYDITASPKTGEISGRGEYIALKVIKIWNDSGVTGARPAFIEVHLFCDGELFDSVRITAGDSWRWSWDGLEKDHVWTVVEEAVKNYTVSVERNRNTFAITNSYHSSPTPTPTPTPTPAPTPTPGVTPTPVPTAQPSPTVPPVWPPVPPPPYNPGLPILPQTGQLWWPVPALAGAGMLLIVLGMLLDRRRDDDE